MAGQVVIGFEEPSYTVSEGTPQQEVCAVVIEGTINRDVTVVLQTQPGSATGGQPIQHLIPSHTSDSWNFTLFSTFS